MKELIIALGLFFFIEGILYALFPSKMKSILLKAKDAKESQLRTGGINFCNNRFYYNLVYEKKWYLDF